MNSAVKRMAVSERLRVIKRLKETFGAAEEVAGGADVGEG